MKDFSILEKKIGVDFKDKNLLRQAVVHRSYLNENPQFDLPHNERLEFLGDAVLELIVTEYLYQTYPERPEGDMTNWRAALVNTQMLAKKAKNELSLSDYLYLSRGEDQDHGKAREAILANAFEAMIGAIFLDQGYDTAGNFVKTVLLKELPEIIDHKLYVDPKSRLQELIQDEINITPTYQVLKEWGPDHAKSFMIGVFLEDKQIGEGEGRSKQEAQIKAATNALKDSRWKETPNGKTV